MVVYGLLGYPLRYSLSPAIHQAAYRALGLEAAYLLWPTAPEGLEGAVADLRQRQDVGGWNVTVPHKSAIMPYLDELAPSAAAVGAVNTVLRSGSKLIGENTDLSGFRASLDEVGVPVRGQVALVLGAGGAARAVCHALLDAGVQRLYLANRTQQRAVELGIQLQAGLAVQGECEDQKARAVSERETSSATDERVRVIAPEHILPRAGDFGVVVNCTSSQDPWPALGVTADEFWARSQGWAVDLAYGRMLAGFLSVAERRGWATLSGEGMLLWQAAHAFERWTGLSAPVPEMRQAMLAEFRRQP